MDRVTPVADTAKDEEDSDLVPDTFSTNKVNQTALVIAGNIQFSRYIPDRTCLKFGIYKGKELLKQRV